MRCVTWLAWGMASVVLAFTPLRGLADEVELILDASNSMWNKLDDGKFRITAAKEALGDFLVQTEGRDDLHIGLRIYGSKVSFREKGACEDTVLVVPVSGFAREEMLKAVRAAKAIGATPIARSLEKAGDDFSREGKKSIILFTDGEESCGGDIKATLEALKARGVDVDLRIIGIGLSRDAVERFSAVAPILNADSAKSLAAALSTTMAQTAQIQTSAAPKEGTIKALLERDGAPFAAPGAKLTLEREGAKFVLENTGEGIWSATVLAGVYRVTVEAPGLKEARVFESVTVLADKENEHRLDVSIPYEVAVKVDVDQVAIGREMEIHYENAKGVEDQFITIAYAGEKGAPTNAWVAAPGRKGTVKLKAPDAKGKVEARFTAPTAFDDDVFGRSRVFEITEVEARLTAPDKVDGGTKMEVIWSGPALEGDFITIEAPDAGDGVYSNGWLDVEGRVEGKADMAVPSKGGTYELRYVLGTNRVLFRKPLEVIEAKATLKAPDEAQAGASIAIEWSGPAQEGDFITVLPPDAAPGAWIKYFEAGGENKQWLTVEERVGDAEIRYVTRDETILARRPIRLVAASAEVKLPSPTLEKGVEFKVSYNGPLGEDDYITIVKKGTPEGEYAGYFRVDRDTREDRLNAPQESGTYEVRYVTGEKGVTLARVEVEVK